MQSVRAYSRLYNAVIEAALAGALSIQILNKDHWKGAPA